MNKLLMVISKVEFRDEEFFTPYDFFTKHGVEVDIACTEQGECIGVKGGEVKANISLTDVKVPDYFAIIFVGGGGSLGYVHKRVVQEILAEAKKLNLIICATSIAPLILSDAGILRGRRATVWNGGNRAAPIIEEAGATYDEGHIIVDGRIITCDGPESITEFAETVMQVAASENLLK